MIHKGLDFHVVRIVCHHCGWYRNIAHSGCADGKRAIVRVEKSKDPSHVLHAKVIEIPEEQSESEWKTRYPEYHDLVKEARKKSLLATMREYSPLLKNQTCPRCKQTHGLELEQFWDPTEHTRY